MEIPSIQEETKELYVLWTSGDKDVAKSMIFMYVLNSKAKGWWEDVCLIIWGPSAKLLANDKELQEQLQAMIDAGVDVVACRACTEMYGVTSALEELGVEVKGMGHPLSQLLKAGKKILSI